MMNRALIIFTLTFLVGTLNSQISKKEVKAIKNFQRYNYDKAIVLYEKLDTSISTAGLRNLAAAYRLSFKVEQAEEAYKNLVSKEDYSAEDAYYYGYVLKENKKYLESKKWITIAEDKGLTVGENVVQAPLNAMLTDKNQFQISNLGINTEQEDFGTAYYGDQVVFASSREGVGPVRRRWNGNKLPFLDLYVSHRASLLELDEPAYFSKVTNKKYHEGPASFNADADFMAFTRNSYTGKSSEGTVILQIFFSSKTPEGEWSEPVSFHKNTEEYSIAHPHLSKDGKTMFFASDMPGGYGKADIYRVDKADDGNWGEPVNLGDKVNTNGNDMFPFYSESKKLLFFASDGHKGLGGLDVYVSPDENGYTNIVNLGVPVNSNVDDFAFVINDEMEYGFFSSNREGGKGDDDIYSLKMLKPFVFGKKIKGVAKDKKGNLLSGVSIYLMESNVIVDSTVTSENGDYSFTAKEKTSYVISGKKEKYFEAKDEVSSFTEQDVIPSTLELEKFSNIALFLLVQDAKTNEPISEVDLKIIDNFSGDVFFEKRMDATGSIMRGVSGKKIGDRLSYNILLEKEGYFPKSFTFNHAITKPGLISVHELLDGGLSLDKEVKDLSELVKINPIKFDVNKYNIRSDAALELDKIVGVLNKYPGMSVELGSHTDCRGSAKYNESLSDKRAKSSAEYIKSKITNPDRISGKGYGEIKILNGCTCEGAKRSTCTKAQHAENRRTEFKVLETGADNLKVENSSTNSFD